MIRALCGLGLLAVASCAGPCGSGNVYRVEGARVISGVEDDEAVVRPIAIAGNRISEAQAGGCAISLAGSYALPGLWDMHVHVTKIGEEGLPLFIANGVTAVRDMGGDPAVIFAMRDRSERGEIVSPLIVTAGPMLESQAVIDAARERGDEEDFSRTRIVLRGVDDAAPAIARLRALGVDFVKLRNAPDDATYEAVLAEARRAGLMVFGHPRNSYDPAEAARRGQRSFEHGFYPYPLDDLDADARADLIDALVETGAAHVPTLVAWRFFTRPIAEIDTALADTDSEIDPRDARLTDALRANWQEYADDNRETTRDYAAWRGYVDQAAADIGTLHEGGVQVFAGTDTAVPLVYPGSSLIDEMQLLVEQAGLTPLEAIAANSWEAADFMEIDDLGRIAAAQRANIIFVDSDPRTDIGALRRIRAVILNGRFFDRGALDRLRDSIGG